MKKLVVLLPLVLILTLAACKPAAVPGNGTTQGTQPVAISPGPQISTQPATEPTTPPTTQPTTAPTTQPTTPTESVDFEAWKAYSYTPLTYILIPGYDPTQSYEYHGEDFDESGLVVGHYYGVDNGDVYPIADQPLLAEDVTSEHVYYVLSSEPTKLYRCSLHGENHTLVYESGHGDISYVQYSGVDANGELFICENKDRIISYDLPTGETDVVMTAHEIQWVYFYRPVAYETATEDKGPFIEWKGSLDGEKYYMYNTYYLLLDTHDSSQPYHLDNQE